jgi:hypothetical protein
VLLDFDSNTDLAAAMKLHESEKVQSSERLSDIVDDARAALTDVFQTDEMKRTRNEKERADRGR